MAQVETQNMKNYFYKRLFLFFNVRKYDVMTFKRCLLRWQNILHNIESFGPPMNRTVFSPAFTQHYTVFKKKEKKSNRDIYIRRECFWKQPDLNFSTRDAITRKLC